jgi:PAS domain S-box-containing protein
MSIHSADPDDHALQVLSTLSSAIARANDLPGVYDAALDGLRDGLGLERASILLFDRDDVMRFVAWRGLSASYRAAVEGHTPWTPDSANPQPIRVEDVEQAPDLAGYRGTFAAEGIGALAFIPLVARDRLLGKFMCYYGAPHAFGDAEIALARTIAQQVAFAVERMRTHDAMQRSELRLRFALDAARMGTWDWDLRTNRVVWSDNLPGIHGLPPGSFNGSFESYEREIHPDDKARVMESASRAMSQGVPHEVEYRIVAPDGTVRWVEGKGRVEYGADGAPARMAGICMDITRRKLAELERAELASRAAFLAEVSTTLAQSLNYETTLQTVASLAVPRIADWCAVHMRRDDGAIEALAIAHGDQAPAAWIRPDHERFSMSPDDLYGVAAAIRTNRSLLHPDISDAQLKARVGDEALREALLALRVRSAMVVPIRASGEVVGAITFLTTGDCARRFGAADLALAEEVAGRAGVAVENARLYTAAREANHLKDEFLATLSHELRTPLNAILGWARMLEQGRIPTNKIAQGLAIIRRNADAQARLISDILDVARISSNKLHLERQFLDVSDVIRLVVDGIESQARESGVTVTMSAQADVTASADSARLQQMAWNLLSNAVKFTPSGGRVHVDVRRIDGRVRLTVTDTGVGIAPDFLPHLFERFRQADASTTRDHGGLGLGLAITRHVAELHGGSVEAASEGAGRGATFSVFLPFAPAPAERPIAERPIGANGGPRLAGLRVLAVDDDHDSRQLVCELLRAAGADVRPAGSADEALHALNTSPVDLVVADIAMPGEDGYSLVRKMSALALAQGRPAIPAIAVTALAREEDRARVLAAGFAAHVPKPVDESLLVQTAETLGAGLRGPSERLAQ